MEESHPSTGDGAREPMLIDSFPAAAELFNDFVGTLRKYKSRAWDPIEPGVRGPHLLWVNLDRLLASILNRSRHTLMEGMFCFNEGGIVSSFLLARSALEVAGAACHLQRKLRAFDADRITADELDESTRQLTLGTRYAPDAENFPAAVGLMTMIDAADKAAASSAAQLKGKTRNIYEYLSEYVHPNHNGLRLGSHLDDHGVLHFHEGATWRQSDVTQVLTAFNISGWLTLQAYDEGTAIITKHRPPVS